MEHIINPVYYQDFILSGKPEFTLRSVKTGNEQIFVVNLGKAGNVYWVNNSLRQMIGRICMIPGASENLWGFEQNTKDILAGQVHQMEIFGWLWHNVMLITQINDGRWLIPERLNGIQMINHMGWCGRCHRPLDDPDSMKIGIGPDCFKKLGLTHKTLVI